MMCQRGFLAIVTVMSLTGVTIARAPQKIVGGDKCAVGEYPHQVSLRIDGKHICGGTIISNRHILTAAHCVLGITTKPYKNLVVTTGSVKRQGGESHIAKGVLCHPNYIKYSQGSPNDIAVIVLEKELQFNSVQNKLALPTSLPPSGAHAKVIGWGYQMAGSKVAADELMKLDVITTRSPECHMMFRGTTPIYPQHICTIGALGRGFCQGDSGGPLIFEKQIVGIVSFNVPCGKGFPDVYTSVYHFVPWITKVMKAYT